MAHSSNSIRLSALESDEVAKESVTSSPSTSKLPEEDPEDPFASSAGPKEAKTFNELFGAAYDSHLKSLGVEEEDGAASHQEREAAHFARQVRDGSSLAASEFAFARLFKLQIQAGDGNMNVHAMALEGWKGMIDAYIRHGSEEQLNFFLDTYEAMYGLDARDRALIILKFHCQQSPTSDISSTFHKIINEGEFDDRIFAVAASALARKGKFDDAFKILDDAWMRALANPQFKMTPVFYRSAAEICVRNLNLPRLSDVFIRLNANKPPVNSNFFFTIFRAINARIGAENTFKSNAESNAHSEEKDLKSTDSSTSSPITSTHTRHDQQPRQRSSKSDREKGVMSHASSVEDDLLAFGSQIEAAGIEGGSAEGEGMTHDLKRDSAQSAASLKLAATVDTLKSMYDLVEKSMAMHAVHPNTELRNEMIAFKLYTESNIQSMLAVISQYSTKPDDTTLNLLLDALLHEKKISLARTICDAWDAQFGVKLTTPSSLLISRYADLFCRDLLHTASQESFGQLELASNEVALVNGIPQFNSIYRDLKAPIFELLDELVSPNQQVKLGAPLRSLTKLLKALDDVEVSGAFRGLHSLVLYLETREVGTLPTDPVTLYEISKLVHNIGLPELGKRVTNVARKQGIPHAALTGLIALDIMAAAEHLSLADTKSLWRDAVKEDQVDASPFAMNAYLRTLLRRDFDNDANVAKEACSVVHAIATGKTAFSEPILQHSLRLLHRCNRVRRLPFTRVIFELEQMRRAKKLPLRLVTASQFALLLKSRTKFALTNDRAEPWCEKLDTFISDANQGKYAETADPALEEEFETVLDELKDILPAINSVRNDRNSSL